MLDDERSYQPDLRQKLEMIFSKLEENYGRMDIREIPADLPPEIITEISSKFEENDRGLAVEEALRMWSDFRDRQIGLH